ncbi:uncharacterized protein LOC110271875 isoform X2 [Arachis ipaensis]|uniref:uncharacterized protein n=2 Tax=Arachis TaxID=3817 RepID=UPI000A2B030A|nr:uncharacterized protein LOC110271875 isoform X2 [Arachis ipaensis]
MFLSRWEGGCYLVYNFFRFAVSSTQGSSHKFVDKPFPIMQMVFSLYVGHNLTNSFQRGVGASFSLLSILLSSSSKGSSFMGSASPTLDEPLTMLAYVFLACSGSSCIQSSTRGMSAVVPVKPSLPYLTFFTLRWRRSCSCSVGWWSTGVYSVLPKLLIRLGRKMNE